MANIHLKTEVNGKKAHKTIGVLYFRIEQVEDFDGHVKNVMEKLRNRGKSL